MRSCRSPGNLRSRLTGEEASGVLANQASGAMDFLALQTSRLVAAVPRDKASIAEAFDVDDVVTRRRGGLGVLGLVIRTPKGIEQCSQDEDPGRARRSLKAPPRVCWKGLVAFVEGFSCFCCKGVDSRDSAVRCRRHEPREGPSSGCLGGRNGCKRRDF